MRKLLFKKVIAKFNLCQSEMCRQATAAGKPIDRHQLARWLNTDVEFSGDTIEALEVSLPPQARNYYIGELVKQGVSISRSEWFEQTRPPAKESCN